MPVPHQWENMPPTTMRAAPFPKPVPIVLPMSRLAEPPRLHHQYRLSGTGAQRARTTRRSFRQPADAFMLLSFGKLGITRTPTATTSPSCSTRTRSILALRSSPSPKPPQAKTHVEWLLWLFVDCCNALPLQTLPRSRSAQSAQKLDGSTPRSHAHTVQHNVDFIGGDFNMSAFSTMGNFFLTRSSWLLAMLSCGALVAWTNHARTARASSP